MNITQFLLILYARKWIILLILLVTVATTLVVSLMLPKQYTAASTLVLNFKSSNPVTGAVLPAQFAPGYLATQADIISSHNVALKVVENLRLIEDSPHISQQFQQATGGKGTIKDWLADTLLQKLDATPSRESSVIEISFTGSEPNFAAILANGFADAYIQTNLELSVQPAKQSSEWYDQQIAKLRENLETAQTRLSEFQREKGVVLSDERVDIETARLGELSGQAVAAQSAAYDALSRKSQRETSAEVANNSLVQNLKVQMAQSESRLAELERKTGKNHPEYLRAIAQHDSIQQELDAAIRTATKSVAATASAAQQRLGGLRSAVATQKAKVMELKEQHDEIAVLVRDVENAQRIYDSALQRAGQIKLESQSSQTEIAILNRAVPPVKPSSPRVFLNLFLSFFLGSLLGIAVGMLLELIDRRVRSEQDIAEGLDIPVLGSIQPGRPSRRFPFGFSRPGLRTA